MLTAEGAIKMNIPLIDLKAQYKSISGELDKVVLDVLSSAGYIMGKNVKEFVKEFAEYIGVKHAISVGNGTDALIITLKALGIGKGDEVITSTFTYYASAECISAVGATPVFVDVEKDTFNIDPAKIEEKITSKTKAIIPKSSSSVTIIPPSPAHERFFVGKNEKHAASPNDPIFLPLYFDPTA